MFEPLRCSRYHEGRSTTGDGSTQSQRGGQSSGGWIALLVGFFSVVAMSALVIRRTSR